MAATFLSTLASGFTFIGMMYLLLYAGADIVPTPLGVFMGIIFGTAAVNAIIVQVLYVPLKLALKRRTLDMIRFEQVGFQYKGASTFALRDISLTIKPGEFVGIIGSSGAGKTSLTRCINGVIPHHFPGDFYGAVTVDGMDTVVCGLDALSRKVGSVFQDIDGQMVASLVEDELLFGLENFAVPREEIPQRISAALEALGIAGLRQRAIASLSGGQSKRSPSPRSLPSPSRYTRAG